LGAGDGAAAKPLRNLLQLAGDRPETDHQKSGAGRDRACDDQRIAEPELLVRDPVTERAQTRQQQA
jgi:hypothetical protein